MEHTMALTVAWEPIRTCPARKRAGFVEYGSPDSKMCIGFFLSQWHHDEYEFLSIEVHRHLAALEYSPH
jgi:hypothetical protein